jgi:hypothetical protein
MGAQGTEFSAVRNSAAGGAPSNTASIDAHVALLTRYLSQRDLRCPSCRYNLRDVQSAACPECGDPLELTIGLKAPKKTARDVAVAFVGMLTMYAWIAAAAVVYLDMTAPRPTFDLRRAAIVWITASIATVGFVFVRRRQKLAMKQSLRQLRLFMVACIVGSALFAAVSIMLFSRFGGHAR